MKVHYYRSNYRGRAQVSGDEVIVTVCGSRVLSRDGLACNIEGNSGGFFDASPIQVDCKRCLAYEESLDIDKVQ